MDCNTPDSNSGADTDTAAFDNDFDSEFIQMASSPAGVSADLNQMATSPAGVNAEEIKLRKALKDKARRGNMTVAQKQIIALKEKARRDNMSAEQKQIIALKAKARRDKRSEDQKTIKSAQKALIDKAR